MPTARTPILLIDGGLGTTLEASPYNAIFSADTPLWSSHLLVSDPTTLRKVHQSFVQAGADVILTATYQASVSGFAQTLRATANDIVAPSSSNPNTPGPAVAVDDARRKAGYEPAEAAHYMCSSISLAQDACRNPTNPARLALSLGPFGATLTPVAAEYSGLYPIEMDSEDALRTWHADRLRVYAESASTLAPVEFIAFETVRRADEAHAVRWAMEQIILTAASSIRRRQKWWISGVFPNDEVDESEVREWVRAAIGPGLPRPWGIGLNCVQVGHVSKIVQVMAEELKSMGENGVFVDEWEAGTSRPWLVAYPDGTRGERYDTVKKQWVVYEGSQQAERAWDEQLWEAIESIEKWQQWEGIVVGGCCRTGVREIAALRQRINGRL